MKSVEQAGFTATVILIGDGEAYKTQETLATVYDQFVAADMDRSCGVIALGGGVVGDLAGYAASSYMRGIACVQVPTTLLAQVDSSVGARQQSITRRVKTSSALFINRNLSVSTSMF